LTLVCMWFGKSLLLVSTMFRLGLVRFGLNHSHPSAAILLISPSGASWGGRLASTWPTS
jgi:hypothetical protein